MKNVDFLIIGGGVVGLTIARELKLRYKDQSVVVLEKEPQPGLHGSGRNSGVLHSGVYYEPSSLKAKICAQGAKEMAEYCSIHGLPLVKPGKILLPTRSDDSPQLDVLEMRGKANGVEVQRINETELRDLEPDVRSATGSALRVLSTSVVSPPKVMNRLSEEIRNLGVEIKCGGGVTDVKPAQKQLAWNGEIINYGRVINCAGVYADKIAHQFGAGKRFTVLPFRGSYWKLSKHSPIRVKHLIYPVPDLNVPFLGVHTTTTVDGDVYLGPTATPALGRENYSGMSGVQLSDLAVIGAQLTSQFIANRDGFRRLAWQESRRVFRSGFFVAAQKLLPRLQKQHLEKSTKVGIRAQMLDRKTGRLVMDFLVEKSESATHVLNAISPAFTCSFPLARLIVDEYLND